MYFDEFVEVCQTITSEFAYGVLDTMYNCIPCLRNHFRMLANFKQILVANKFVNLKPFHSERLAPPFTEKLRLKCTKMTQENVNSPSKERDRESHKQSILGSPKKLLGSPEEPVSRGRYQ